MKVLDLQCGLHHVFEGWFASEADFQLQREREMIACPICNDLCITKKLSAPRLNLGAVSNVASPLEEVKPESSPGPVDIQSAMMAVARRIIANTDDVGDQFAEEARKIHYGESKVRAIRGQATVDEQAALIEEGIDVLSLPLPESLKGQMQ